MKEKNLIGKKQLYRKIVNQPCIKLVGSFPGCRVDENLPANEGDMGSVPGLGKFHMLWNS